MFFQFRVTLTLSSFHEIELHSELSSVMYATEEELPQSGSRGQTLETPQCHWGYILSAVSGIACFALLITLGIIICSKPKLAVNEPKLAMDEPVPAMDAIYEGSLKR